MFRRVVFGCVLVASVATADTAAPPRRKAALLRWLRAGTYRAVYAGEPAVHGSRSAHGASVRTFYSPVLAHDLSAGRTTFRKGAAMVKELYFGGDTLRGWSVMSKLRRRAGPAGQGWLFYESFDGTNDGAPFGRGIGLCVGCHHAGTDFLLSDFRP